VVSGVINRTQLCFCDPALTSENFRGPLFPCVEVLNLNEAVIRKSSFLMQKLFRPDGIGSRKKQG
jgi:hypothetical protein